MDESAHVRVCLVFPLTEVNSGSRKLLRPLLEYYLYALRKRLLSWLGAISEFSTESPKARAVIFDPALREYQGHHLEFARLLRTELAKTFVTSGYVHFRARTGIITALRAQPVCFGSTYVESSPTDFDAIYCAETRDMLKSLQNVKRSDLGPNSIFILHTLTAFQLEGLAHWYTALDSIDRPKLFLQFQFPLEFGAEESDWPQLLERVRTAASALASAGTVRFSTNSHLMMDRICNQLGQPVALMPVPIRWPVLSRANELTAGPVFGFFGGLRQEKGSRLLAEAIPTFSARHQDARFIIHAPGTESDPVALRALEHLPRVEIIRQSFRSKDDYFDAFSRAGCILLPYDPAKYAVRTSAILLEAVGLGRLVITTDHSWLAAELRKRKAEGFVMPNFTVPDLIDCLAAARSRLIGPVFQPRIDADLIVANSPVSFCTSLIRLMSETPTLN
jgi:glycosyltransferase involved in cell wall biosynthesis